VGEGQLPYAIDHYKQPVRDIIMEDVNIMIVEDEVIVAKEIETSLKGMGYSVTSMVNTGEAAIEKAERESPDIILMDIQLNGQMDGIEAAEVIRSRFEVPIIFLTAYADEQKLSRAKPTLPFGYVLKPFRDHELKVAIEMALHVSRVDTERMKIEQALREERDRAQIYLDLAGVIFVTLNNKGEVTLINKKGGQILGYEEEQIVGKNWFDNFLPKRCSEEAKSVSDRLLAGELEAAEYFEHLVLTKDGEERLIAWRYTILKDEKGEITGHLGSGADITDSRKAAEELRESEEKYRTILENIEEGYYEVDLAGNFTFFNDAMCKIRGYSRDELIGMNNRQYMTQDTTKKVYEAFNKVYTTGKPAKNLEWETIRPDGSTRYVEVSASLMNDSDGRPIGFRGIVRDVTERKTAEKEKAKLQAQLQRAQKMEAIGTLAGGVAHDLNNVLSSVVGYPELILMDLPEDSHLRKSILTIQKSGHKAASIVNDLLTLARRAVPVMEVVTLNHITSEYLKGPEHEKLKSFHPDVLIETDLDTGLLNILGSPVHLAKTIMNLVSNAAEAMPDGGKIFISTKNRYIDKTVRGYNDVNEGDYVVLTISDTGVGISREDMERIFEPFYTKKVMGRSGTGLGMAVVWGAVKDLNGYIDVESTEGKGTTFTLYFPVCRKELAHDKSQLPIEDYMGKGESILVVDDVEEQREIASNMLSKLGYIANTVSSGEEAVDYMKHNSTDLLVLDMIMDPGIDGFETYKKILELHPRQKALISSGFSETDRVREAQNLGAGHYIKKPYTLEKIGIAVRDELSS